MSRPLVSVVMPVKNAAPFLEEAAASVLAQTHEPVELVVVDDGSTDGSERVADSLEAAHPGRVRVLRHSDGLSSGTGVARALGVEQSRGELVAFLDADDVWAPGHLKHEVALLDRHPEAGMVCGRAWRWRSWADPQDRDELSPLPFAPGVVVRPPDLLVATLRNGSVAVHTCSLLVRREALRGTGDAVSRSGDLYEDQVMNSLLQLRTAAVISGAATAYYRQHETSASAVAQRQGRYHPAGPSPSRARFLTWLSGLPELRPESADPELRALLDAALEEQRVGTRAPIRVGATGVARRVARGAKRVVPDPVGRRLRELQRPRAVGRVRWGSLGSLEPISRHFGFDRGTPVDRWYIDRFLDRWASDIRGRVLEVGDDSYTRRHGGRRVEVAEVLNVSPDAPGTTIVGDLNDPDALPPETFDCLLITQTLHLVYDIAAAASGLYRALRPGGALLLTVPGITPISRDRWAATWHWSLTQLSAERLFGDLFGWENVTVRQYGNALAATAFLQGIAAEEVRVDRLAHRDPQFPVVITVRALKPVPEAPLLPPGTP